MRFGVSFLKHGIIEYTFSNGPTTTDKSMVLVSGVGDFTNDEGFESLRIMRYLTDLNYVGKIGTLTLLYF
jgi:hypothetical protein